MLVDCCHRCQKSRSIVALRDAYSKDSNLCGLDTPEATRCSMLLPNMTKDITCLDTFNHKANLAICLVKIETKESDFIYECHSSKSAGALWSGVLLFGH